LTTALTAAEKSGSSAFTTCVLDTAPAPSDTTVAAWPAPCARLIGSAAPRAARTSRGAARAPAAHAAAEYAAPTPSCAHAASHGSAHALSTRLFSTL